VRKIFKILIIVHILYSIPAGSYSQITVKNLSTIESKDSSYLQYNLLFDNARENVSNIGNVHRSNNIGPFTIGTEISRYFYSKDYPLIELYGASLSIYQGYSSSSGKVINGFGELPNLNTTDFNKRMEYNSSDGYIFFNPGISVFSKNRKFSLDLYQEYSTQILMNKNLQIVPCKVRIHF
jgi:hypothetical protein